MDQTPKYAHLVNYHGDQSDMLNLTKHVSPRWTRYQMSMEMARVKELKRVQEELHSPLSFWFQRTVDVSVPFLYRGVCFYPNSFKQAHIDNPSIEQRMYFDDYVEYLK